eukprot:3451417-Rhodomonas_salina.1
MSRRIRFANFEIRIRASRESMSIVKSRLAPWTFLLRESMPVSRRYNNGTLRHYSISTSQCQRNSEPGGGLTPRGRVRPVYCSERQGGKTPPHY